MSKFGRSDNQKFNDLYIKKKKTKINEYNYKHHTMFSPDTTRAVFINLPECTERCANVTKELACVEPLFGKAERADAVRHTEGWRGCAQSHVRVLRNASETYPPNVQFLAVFEDDFMWCSEPLAVLQQVQTDFDVLMLVFPVWLPDESSFIMSDKDPHVLQIINRGFLTTAYIVHRRYWATLADHWAQETQPIDVAWQELQAKHRFFVVAPTLGNQKWYNSSTIQNYAYRNFQGKVDMSVMLVFNNVSRTDLPLARRLFKHVDLKRHPDILRYAQRFTSIHDAVICIEGPGVSHRQISVALHNCWKEGFGLVLIKKESANNYFIQRPLFAEKMRIAICGLETYGLGTRDGVDALLADWQKMFPDKPLATGLSFLKSTDSLQAATHVLMINYGSVPPELDHVPQENVVHISMEPVAFLRLSRYRRNVIEKRARVSIGGINHPSLTRTRAGFVIVPSPAIQAIPHVLKPWPERAVMSIVFSNAQVAPGHKYRHQLARAIADSGLPVDFWGHGAHSLLTNDKQDARVKGSFDNVEPYINYRFTIAIENHQEGYYFTEKITLPIYCACMPLYLGSPHIEKFFPGASIALTGKINTDLDIIKNIIASSDNDLQERVICGRTHFQQKWHWGEYLHQVFHKKS